MAGLKDIVAANINGKGITLYDIFYSLKINGKLDLLRNVFHETLVAQAVEQEGITVSDEELQKTADGLRQALGLHMAGDTQNWLKANHVTVEDLEVSLERSIATEKLKDKVVVNEAVEKYFAENRSSFDSAKIAQIVAKEEGMAQELLAQITDEDADFYALARQQSIDKGSKEAGGYLGFVNRKALSPQVENAVFGASPGKVVGPVKTDQGYHLIKVLEFGEVKLDEDMSNSIKNILFEQWLADEMSRAEIEDKLTPLLE